MYFTLLLFRLLLQCQTFIITVTIKTFIIMYIYIYIFHNFGIQNGNLSYVHIRFILFWNSILLNLILYVWNLLVITQ